MLRPLLLTLAGLIVAGVPVYLGLPDVPAPIVFAVLLAAAAWGIRVRRSVVGFVPAIVLVLYGTWFYWLSSYDDPEAAPSLASTAPDFGAVRVRDGAPFRLAAQRGHGVLLVFFRGDW